MSRQFFVLTQDVTVPDPEGILWDVTSPWGSDVTFHVGTHFERFDNSLYTYHSSLQIDPDQENLISPFLEPAEPKIGQWFQGSPEALLAALGELGLATQEMVLRASELVHHVQDDEDPHAYRNFLQRNWITYYPS